MADTKVVRVNGKLYRVPADATPEEIDQISSDIPRTDPAGRQSTGTISARESGITHPINWLEDLQGDIMHGSGDTFPGRVLRGMGAHGLQSGVNEGTARMIGGPLIGPVDVAHGVSTGVTGHPIKGINEAVRGVGESALPVIAATNPELLPRLIPAGTGLSLIQRGVQGAGEKLGIDPDYAELAGNAAAVGAAAAPHAWPYVRRPLGIAISKGADAIDAVTHPAQTLRNLGDRWAEQPAPATTEQTPEMQDFMDRMRVFQDTPQAPPPRDFASANETVGQTAQPQHPSANPQRGVRLLPKAPTQYPIGVSTRFRSTGQTSPSPAPEPEIILPERGTGGVQQPAPAQDDRPVLFGPTGSRPGIKPAFPQRPARPVTVDDVPIDPNADLSDAMRRSIDRVKGPGWNAPQGGHAGGVATSVEELNRPGKNYVVSKSGNVTYHGKAFDPGGIPEGASHVTVLPNGELRVNAGQTLSKTQENALRKATE